MKWGMLELLYLVWAGRYVIAGGRGWDWAGSGVGIGWNLKATGSGGFLMFFCHYDNRIGRPPHFNMATETTADFVCGLSSSLGRFYP